MVFALMLGGCATPADQPDWRDQLVPDSPCYRVNLLDGLDESSTAEVRDTFACVDNGGQLDPYQPVVDALEAESRGGVPAGVEVARMVNALPAAGVDPWGLAGVAVRAIQDDRELTDDLLDLVLEGTYGEAAGKVRAGGVTLDDPAALSAGILVPMGPVVRDLATAALDDDLEGTRWAGEVLGTDESERWIRTFGALAASDDPDVRGVVDPLLVDAGRAIRDTRDASNDVASSASGDSLRDLAGVLVDGDLLSDVAPEAGSILGDDTVRPKLATKLEDWHRRGHLQRVGAELKWLASVDVDGESLGRNEPSALQALIALLHDTNRPMKCSFDLWVTDLEVDLGNLAVAILDLLAGMDPDLVSGGVGILASILGWDLSESILEEIADSGACPALSQSVVINLHTLDLLADDRAYDLLVVTTEGLDVLKKGREDHIPDVADLLTTVQDDGGSAPIAELVRDVGDAPLVDDVVGLVPILADPASYGISDGVDLGDGLAAASALFLEDDGGKTAWEHACPLVRPVVARDETWVVVGRAGALLRQDGSVASQALDLVPRILDMDPDLQLAGDGAALLGNPKIAGPMLRILETDGVLDEALATDGDRVPLAFTADLVVDGTMDDLLAVVHTVLTALDGYRESP